MSADPVGGHARVLSAAEALDLLGAGFDDQAVGPLAGRAVIAVRTDDSPDLDVLCPLVASRALVVIGVAPAGRLSDEPPPFDVLLTDHPKPPAPWVGCPSGVAAELDRLTTAIDNAPQAAVVLCQVLRSCGDLGVADGLVLESLAYSTLQSGRRFAAWIGERGHRAHAVEHEPAVLCERTDDVLTVTLNRPRVHNAMDTRLRESLAEALQLAVADSSIARVVVRGAGASFSSGGDLSEFGTLPDPATAHIIRTTRSPASWMARVAERTTVEVHGTCVGAGVELSAFARRVVSTPDATFRLPEVAMGLIPGAGGTVSIPRRIGRPRTAYLALSNVAISARQAHEWGLVDEIRS